jgi:diketogulonate reductase-like aldo/keto reductase
MTDKSTCLALNNGVEMPAVGLGVFQSSPADTVSAVETAQRGGYRLIDTAASYDNEREVGEGIVCSGVERVRAIGVSNQSQLHLQNLMDRTAVVPAVNQVEVHPYFAQPSPARLPRRARHPHPGLVPARRHQRLPSG